MIKHKKRSKPKTVCKNSPLKVCTSIKSNGNSNNFSFYAPGSHQSQNEHVYCWMGKFIIIDNRGLNAVGV